MQITTLHHRDRQQLQNRAVIWINAQKLIRQPLADAVQLAITGQQTRLQPVELDADIVLYQRISFGKGFAAALGCDNLSSA